MCFSITLYYWGNRITNRPRNEHLTSQEVCLLLWFICPRVTLCYAHPAATSMPSARFGMAIGICCCDVDNTMTRRDAIFCVSTGHRVIVSGVLGCRRHRPGRCRNHFAAGPTLGAGRRAAGVAIGGWLEHRHAVPHQILNRLLHKVLDRVVGAENGLAGVIGHAWIGAQIADQQHLPGRQGERSGWRRRGDCGGQDHRRTRDCRRGRW